jgi:hypothetical protein
MQATIPHRRIKHRPIKALSKAVATRAKNPVAEEIFAFIAMRDLLLAEAEEETTEATLHRLWMANEFAERCLDPARPPYDSQMLPASEASRERQRCKTIKQRIATLRAALRPRAA